MERTDFDLAVNELIYDIVLVLLEDLPHLSVQIAYGVLTGQADNISVAWFVAIFSTAMHMASQVHEIIYLAYQLPKLKKLEGGQIIRNQEAAGDS